MKRIVAGLILTFMAVAANAQHHGHFGHGYHHRGGVYYGGNNWIAPALIGGVIGYELSRNNSPVVVQQPIIVQQPSIIVQQPPAELVYIDGVAYKKQVMVINGVAQEVLLRL
jgi:hypothetical protein